MIARDKLLRLETAAAEAFPDGSVTVASLRREIAAGRLAAWRLAGKHMTTLQAIDEMVERCRVQPKAQGSGGESPDQRKREDRLSEASGSSGMTATSTALDAARLTARVLRERCRNGSLKSIPSRVSNVVSMPSRSPMS